MPLYDYKCKLCKNIRTIRRRISDTSEVECCGVDMDQILRSAPNTVITPAHQAVKDKFKYYGVTNAITGEGITKDTDVSNAPGISIADIENT